MGRQGKALLALVFAAAIVAAPSAPAKAGKFRRCAAVSYQTGGGYYFYKSSAIRAHGLACGTARRIARVRPEDVAGSGSEPRRFRRYGYVCRGRKKGRSVPFTCKKGRAQMTFTWTES